MKSILYIVVVILVLTGCYKDKGNYEYIAINDIKASFVSDTFRVIRLDTLTITPKLSGLDTNRLHFEWRIVGVSDPNEPLGIGKIVTLSRERRFKEQITLPATSGYYLFDFVAIDTVTNVKYFTHLRLQVSTELQTGWMFLEQNQSNGDISFLTPADKVIRRVYSAGNPEKPLPLSVRELHSYATGSLLGTLNLVYFDGGGYILDNTSLQVKGNYEDMFYVKPEVVNPSNMIKPSPFNYGPYTFNNGKVYALNGTFASLLFGTAFTPPDNKGYYLAPYVAGGLGNGGVFFDQANYRFLYDGGAASTSLKVFPVNTSMAFDLNNVKKKMLIMKAGLGPAIWPSNWYAVFKNENNDSCFLYTINASGNMTTAPVAEAYQPILNSPDVHRSPTFLFSNSVKQMYYAADNKLY
ncbi:MAG TPA: PKD-like family lipoprotein, partial [Parasegetibacter sp.]